MRLLLDTHAFLWWLTGNRQLQAEVRQAISDELNETLVSAASAWEIATKYRLGKLPGARELADDIPAAIASQGFTELAISVEDAARAGALAGVHRDPFDRMLVAQAQRHELTLVSNEKLFDRYGVRRIW